MPIQPKGIILHSMSEFLMWEGKKLYAKDFLKKLGLSVHGFIKFWGRIQTLVNLHSKSIFFRFGI